MGPFRPEDKEEGSLHHAVLRTTTNPWGLKVKVKGREQKCSFLPALFTNK